MSAVPWEAISEEALVVAVVSVSRSDSSDEVRWEELRDGAASTWAKALLVARAADLGRFDGARVVWAGTGLTLCAAVAALAESESLDSELLTEDGAGSESGDDVLENTL